MTGRDTRGIDRRTVLKTTGAALSTAALGAVASATPGRSPGPKPDEVLVGVSAGAGRPSEVVADHVPAGGEVVHENERLRYVAVNFAGNEQARDRFLRAVTRVGPVKYAEPNATHTASYTPNDPQFDQQYAPQLVNADAAWDTTLGSSSVTVAVVDQGVQYDHPDLDGNMDGSESNFGQDFVDDDEDPYPDDLSSEYHGTHVAGIAGAETDNGEGIAGVSDSALLSARALSESGSGSTADIADAIVWAADQGVDVINLSLGGGGYTDTMKNAVSYADDNGVLLVAAAGNAGESSVDYPAAYSECLAVSALDPDESLASYSNYGSEIELAAPGSDVLSTYPTDTYETLSGTSMATPVVAGVAGLALAQWDLTNGQLRKHLKGTADDVGLSTDAQGCGRVDAQDAVETDPANRSCDCTTSCDGDGGGGGGSCGDTSTSASVSDSLSGYWDEDCWTYAWEYADPCEVVVDLDGPADADFDLYVNTGDTACPTTSDYDYRSISTDSQESITVTDPDTSTDLHILVDSYSGDGSYTLSITEKTT